MHEDRGDMLITSLSPRSDKGGGKTAQRAWRFRLPGKKNIRDKKAVQSAGKDGAREQSFTKEKHDPSAGVMRLMNGKRGFKRKVHNIKMRYNPGRNKDDQRDGGDTAPLGFGEKLLRNIAIGAALVLGVMAMQNIDAPWTKWAQDSVRSVLSMDLEEPESIGKLKFVQNLVPETVLVFWNNSQDSSPPLLEMPNSGAVVHPWSEAKPWLEIECENSVVTAMALGEVTKAIENDGYWTVRIAHEGGLESVYQNLYACTLHEGDLVESGVIVGVMKSDNNKLRIEVRKDSVSVNPADYIADDST